MLNSEQSMQQSTTNTYRCTSNKKKEIMYLPFDVISPTPASDDLDGPAVGDPS